MGTGDPDRRSRRNGSVAFVGEPAELTDEAVFAAYVGTPSNASAGV